MRHLIGRFLRDESGESAIEYGLIITFIALMIISAIKPLGSRLGNKFGIISNSLS